MKKFLWVVFLISGYVSAQELDSMAVDSIEIEPPTHYFGVYIDGAISYEASAPDNNYFGVFGAGVRYDRWSIGFSRYEFLGTTQSLVVFPSTFELKYRYAGLNLEYQFYEKDWVELIVSVNYNKGDMVWVNIEDGEDFLRDKFDLIKFGLRGELSKFQYIKPYVSAGYQKMNKLNINQVTNDNFSGLFVAAGIRIGYFNQ